ncbi:MAG: hypothetical protein ACT4P8_19495 [Betaproteobacteria bacterium]
MNNALDDIRAASALACLMMVSILATSVKAAAPPAKVIELTQLPCQFLESEGGIDRKYVSRSIRDCTAINEKTAQERLASARPLELQPGKYIFRVTNSSVPYELGFWLRGASAVSRVTLPSVSGGGLVPGKTRDYEIELKPGEYVYSCPLNNTPDYRLLVR